MTRKDAWSERVRSRRLLQIAVALAIALVVAPLAPGAAASASPPPSADRPLWVLPDNGDLLAGFDRDDYNEADGAPEQVASPSPGGSQALQITVDGGGKRSEIKPRIPDQREGDVQYYSYSALLDSDFPTDAETWQLLLQWHQYDASGSPPVAVEVRQNRLMLATEGEDLQDLGAVSGGDQIDLTMRIAFSRDPDESTIDVWRGGDHVLRGYHPPGGTLVDDGNYMKVGIYRDTSIEQTARLWINDLRIGPTLSSVRSPESRSVAIPSESDPAGAPTASSSSDTAIWVAAGLLALVVLLAAGSLRLRRGQR